METPVGRAEHGGREWESLQSLSGEGRAEWSSEIAGKSPGQREHTGQEEVGESGLWIY